MRLQWLVPVLLAAAVVPYLAGQPGWDNKVPNKFTALVNQIESWNSPSDHSSSPSNSSSSKSVDSSSSNHGDSASSTSSHSVIDATPVSGSKANSVSGSTAGQSSATLSSDRGTEAGKETEQDPIYDFHEILRFDVTPRWVVSHWPRVTTVLAEMELEGLRVALVTGTKSDDIAGSLTYYFDKNHVVQRLTFQGFTGDDRRLVKFAATAYKMKPHPTLSAGLYLIQWNGKPRSALRITHLPVVRANSPNLRQEISLEINRPRSYYGMSAEFEATLEADRANGRW